MISACEAANLEAKKENNLVSVERGRSSEHVRGLENQLDESAAVRRELERQLAVALPVEQKDTVIKRLAAVQADAASAVAAANVDERDAQTQRERTELKQQLETSKGEANAALSRHAASQAMLAKECRAQRSARYSVEDGAKKHRGRTQLQHRAGAIVATA